MSVQKKRVKSRSFKFHSHQTSTKSHSLTNTHKDKGTSGVRVILE